MTLEDFLKQKKQKKGKREQNFVDPRKLLEKLDDEREKIRKEQETSYDNVTEEKTQWSSILKREEKDGWNVSTVNEDEDDLNFIVPVATEDKNEPVDENKPDEDPKVNTNEGGFTWSASNPPPAAETVKEEKIVDTEPKSYVPAPLRSGASYTPAGAKPNVCSATDFPSLGVVGSSEPVKPKVEVDLEDSKWIQVTGNHKNDYDYSSDRGNRSRDYNDRSQGFERSRDFGDRSDNRRWQDQRSDAPGPVSWRKGVNVTKNAGFNQHQQSSFASNTNKSSDAWVRKSENTPSMASNVDKAANQAFVIHQSNRFSALEEKN